MADPTMSTPEAYAKLEAELALYKEEYPRLAERCNTMHERERLLKSPHAYLVDRITELREQLEGKRVERWHLCYIGCLTPASVDTPLDYAAINLAHRIAQAQADRAYGPLPIPAEPPTVLP